MSRVKTLLMSVACVALAFGNVVNAVADEKVDDEPNEFVSKIASGENVVLYKIHDINTLKSDTGDTSECEFSLTLYNRSPKTVEAATINLLWADESIGNVIDKEKQLELEEDKPVNERLAELQEQANPKTESLVSKDLTASVILPKIKPFRQVTLKSKIKSDRCFLMLDNVKATFPLCSIVNEEANNSGAVRALGVEAQGSNECASLFRFVSPKDPEYYREFQKVSFNEEINRRAEEKKKNLDEIETQYNKILQDANNITTVLESIK
ncbi:MAG: hypothetical protein IJ660_02310 [Alphaproteobacteria bacterium]|nr:hypothetical protein [Alphaproteobacteria bacterium]